MIFVTVGTTAFEGLIEAADKLPKDLDIIIQKADGAYEPKHHEFLEYTHEFEKYVDAAEIIITHGGAGTLFDLMDKGKKIIGIANEERSDHHQADLLQELSDSGYILWCQDPGELAKCVEQAKSFVPKKYQKPENKIAEDIIARFT
jgi:beta-1,4-N-acetylglucosaminyltransferase